jgi:hypothetical protein
MVEIELRYSNIFRINHRLQYLSHLQPKKRVLIIKGVRSRILHLYSYINWRIIISGDELNIREFKNSTKVDICFIVNRNLGYITIKSL